MSNSLTGDVLEILNPCAGDTLYLTVGNSFRKDDGVGPYLAARLATLPVSVVDAGYTPENIVEQVIALKPSRIIVLDAADFGGRAGEVRVIPEEAMKNLFTGRRYKDNYKILSAEVRKLGESIPPLINAYMNLSPTMRTFGTFINRKFGYVEETGIMITLRDIYVEKINRHLASYKKDFMITWFSHERQ